MTERYLTKTDDDEVLSNEQLSPDEIEVQLAIADYVIRRVAGTPEGREIFNALVKQFEHRYPHHKLLTHYLTNPDYLEPDPGYLEHDESD